MFEKDANVEVVARELGVGHMTKLRYT